MAILGNADLALSDLSEVSPVRGNLEEIERSTRRAADLCRQMLAYSGRGKFVVKSIDLSDLVQEMIHMLEISISKKAKLECHLARGLPPIEADASQIQQVVMNLITNASEAIGDQSGVITVTTGCVERSPERLVEGGVAWDLPGGRYVHIEVSDTGCGMDRETQTRLFEPFYSTKFTGRGLGLAAVQGIVQSHHGAITVISEVGHGSTFRALFPVTDATPVADSDVDELSDHAKMNWKGSGTVLIVDDEQAVLNITRQVLRRHGFDVITASDGEEGLRRFSERMDQICCVVLDLTMPHLDGEEVLSEIRKNGNSVPIILTSGYSEQEISRRFLGKGLAAFVQKPYRPADLIATIRKTLEG
jgi:CheY-like chemotaxis protein